MSQSIMPRRPEGPDPPLYPPRLSHRQAVAWVISGLTDKPADPDLGRSPLDTKMRRLVEQEIPDREHREQLKAWCRSQMEEGAFRDICRRRGWNRNSAQRHVDLALAHLFLVMIHQTQIGRLSELEIPDRSLTTVPI